MTEQWPVTVAPRVSIDLTVDGEYMVLVDGVQHGGTRDRSGAGDLTFPFFAQATQYAEQISSVETSG